MINKINKVRNRKIESCFADIKEVVEFVKSPPTQQIELVKYARKVGKGTTQYDDIKIDKLPAICVNFNFSNNYIKGENLKNPTGYLYIDVDGATEQTIDINKDYVCAHWRSLSNNGISIIVKVEGLNKKNYAVATIATAKFLDLPLDLNAISIDRLTVLSYDPNAYFNDNTEIINLADILPEENFTIAEETEKSTQFSNNLNINLGYDHSGYKIRFDNLNENLAGLEIVYDENGVCDLGSNSKINFAKAYLPFRMIHKGQRESIISSFTNQLIALNKDAPRKIIEHIVLNANMKKCFPKLTNEEVIKTVAKKYAKKNSISSKNNDNRRFIYDETKALSKLEKNRCNLQYIARDRIAKTKSDLKPLLENWNFENAGKPTIKKLTELSAKNKKTVQKYYTDLKNEINLDVRNRLVKSYLNVD